MTSDQPIENDPGARDERDGRAGELAALERAVLAETDPLLVFERLYDIAKLKEKLDQPPDAVIAAYLKAADASPDRAEPLHGASRYCRSRQRFEEGFQHARRGLEISLPADDAHVERWIYEYGLFDELAVNGYWSNRHRESLDACLRMLGDDKLPTSERERVAKNARFALEKLPAEPKLGSAGESDLVKLHPLTEERALHSRLVEPPKVLIAILAKQKEEMLPLYLECIEALDYPKSSIVLYVRTNNNTDRTEPMLREWLERVGGLYADVEFDASDVAKPVEAFATHEWNAMRFDVLARIRHHSMQRAIDLGCEFYFISDVDNFIRPSTLRELIALNLPIVAPLLRTLEPGGLYSNFFAEVDARGYRIAVDQYMWILNGWVRGVVEAPLVHATYLVRSDIIPSTSYQDDTGRHEFVIFSESARKANIPQYVDNRQVYGYIAFDGTSGRHVEGGLDIARTLLAKGGLAATPAEHDGAADRPTVFACFGLHSSGSTWMFNLAREICAAGSTPFVAMHRDSSANLPLDAAGVAVIVAKTHRPLADFQEFVAKSSDPVVITVRDPRDAVASLIKRFPETHAFDDALASVQRSAESLVTVSRTRDIPVFRYEDGFIGDAETVQQVAEILGVRLSANQQRALLAKLSPEGVRSAIRSLEAAGAIQGSGVWDAETQWHANHVGDGRVGKWRDVLTDGQAREVVRKTREFCETFGYPAALDADASADR